MTRSNVRVICLSLAFLFAREIRNLHIPAPDSRNLDVGRWPSSNISPQSPSGSSFNPCEGPDAQSACHEKCMAMVAEISTFYNVYRDYKTMKFLHDNCGRLTEGKCDTAASSPICWCHTPMDSNDQWRNTLSNCHRSTLIVRQFANAMTAVSRGISDKSVKKRTRTQVMDGEVEAVGMYGTDPRRPTRPRSASRRRPNPRLRSGGPGDADAPPPEPFFGASSSSAGPSVPRASIPQEDWNWRADGEPEGNFLCTDVRVGGKDVRAMLDTGSGFCWIHKKFAVNMERLDNKSFLFASNQKIDILGRATINVEIKKRVTIPVTGYVTNQKHELVFGTNFYATYKAKIRIAGGTMELLIGQDRVTMRIKLRVAPTWVYMMGDDASPYKGVQIAANVNGRETRMVVDTGSSITFISKNLVDLEKPLRSTTRTCSFAGTTTAGFLGETDVKLQIGYVRLTVPALVPDFIPTRPFLTGNDFNKQYIELIDYELLSVTVSYPGPPGYDRIETRAYIISGQ